jgi:hypothetical protein
LKEGFLGPGSSAKDCAALACLSSRTAKLKVESLSARFLSSLAIVYASPKKSNALSIFFLFRGTNVPKLRQVKNNGIANL